MAHTVFICHSARDKQVADAACAALEARRIPCWIAPRDILGGDEWGKAIVDAINDCRIVLLIFSAHANTSPQVRREVERAVSKAKIIVPFRIEDVLPSDAMEYALGNTHWLDALTPPVEAHLTALADTISRILQRDQPTDPLFTQPPPAVAYQAASEQSAELRAQPPPYIRRQLFWLTGTAFALIVGLSYVLWQRSSAPNPAAIQSPPPSTSTQPASASLPTSSPIAAAIPKPTSVAPSRAKSVPTVASSAKPASASSAIPTAAPVAAPTTLSPSEEFQHGDTLYKAKNFEDAYPFLERACSGGNLGACADLGYMYQTGKAVSKDIGQSVAMYRRACNGGEPNGCGYLGSLYETGSGVSKDLGQAAVLYRKACDGGSLAGCSSLGVFYTHSEGGLPKDFTQAVALYRKACDGGYLLGCNNLGTVYENGTGALKDAAQAVALYRRACDGGALIGCSNLGTMYEKGTGVSKNSAQAIALYRKACDGGNTQGCYKLTRLPALPNIPYPMGP